MNTVAALLLFAALASWLHGIPPLPDLTLLSLEDQPSHRLEQRMIGNYRLIEQAGLTALTRSPSFGYFQDKQISTGYRTVTALDCALNAPLIAYGKEDGSIIVVDTQTGQQITLLHAHKKAVTALCFSPNSRYLISNGLEKSSLVWDLEKISNRSKSLDRLEGQEGMQLMCFSSDGRYFASTSKSLHRNVKIFIWEVPQEEKTSFKLIATYYSQSSVSALTFSPNEQTLIVGRKDALLQAWNLQECSNQKKAPLFEWRAPLSEKAFVAGLCFVGIDRYLIAGSSSGKIHVWDMEQSQRNPQLIKTFRCKGQIISMQTSASGKFLGMSFCENDDEWSNIIHFRVLYLGNWRQHSPEFHYMHHGEEFAEGRLTCWNPYNYECIVAYDSLIAPDEKRLIRLGSLHIYKPVCSLNQEYIECLIAIQKNSLGWKNLTEDQKNLVRLMPHAAHPFDLSKEEATSSSDSLDSDENNSDSTSSTDLLSDQNYIKTAGE